MGGIAPLQRGSVAVIYESRYDSSKSPVAKAHFAHQAIKLVKVVELDYESS